MERMCVDLLLVVARKLWDEAISIHNFPQEIATLPAVVRNDKMWTVSP